MCNNTKGLTEVKCVNDHLFSVRIRKAAKVMFNLFAKNLIADANTQIHEGRKRVTKDPKQSSSARKLKKLSSD